MEIQTTESLIEEVRALADEQNGASRTDPQIIAMMNRGLRYVASRLARSTYVEPLLTRVSIATTDYDADVGLEVPRDAFEDRVLYVQMDVAGGPERVEQRTYRQVNALESSTAAAIPDAWYLRGRRIFFVQPPSGTYAALVDYLRGPDPLTPSQGRITSVDAAALSVTVDEVGGDLSPSSDTLGSFVNVIDPLTGLVRGTFQIASIVGTRVALRASPTRTTVQGRTLDTSFTDLDIAEDDYLCLSKGTCVPQFGAAWTTYLVEYAAAEVNRSLTDAMTQISTEIAKKAGEFAAAQSSGRTSTLRIKNKSRIWGGGSAVRYPTQG